MAGTTAKQYISRNAHFSTPRTGSTAEIRRSLPPAANASGAKTTSHESQLKADAANVPDQPALSATAAMPNTASEDRKSVV